MATAPPILSNWYNKQITGVSTPATHNPMTGLVTAARIGSTAAYQPTQLGQAKEWGVTTPQTVAGQIDTVIAKDSPLMQQAKTAGLEQAASRGLLNSTMAVGSAQDALYKNAMPIAQQDAETNRLAAGYNADIANKFRMSDVDASNVAKTFGASAQNQAKEFNAQAVNRQREFNATYGQNKQLALFDANVKASLDQINNEAQFTLQSQNVYAKLSDTFNTAITSINQDVNMNQQSKDYAIKQLYDAYKAQISILSAVGSIPDISTLLRNDVTTTPTTTKKTTTPTKPKTLAEMTPEERLAAKKKGGF